LRVVGQALRLPFGAGLSRRLIDRAVSIIRPVAPLVVGPRGLPRLPAPNSFRARGRGRAAMMRPCPPFGRTPTVDRRRPFPPTLLTLLSSYASRARNMLLIILCGFDAQMRMNPNDMSVVSAVFGPERSSTSRSLLRIVFGRWPRIPAPSFTPIPKSGPFRVLFRRLPHSPVSDRLARSVRSGRFGGPNAVGPPTESNPIRLNQTNVFLQPRTLNPEPGS
jgi:hypothetical protein